MPDETVPMHIRERVAALRRELEAVEAELGITYEPGDTRLAYTTTDRDEAEAAEFAAQHEQGVDR